MPTNAANERQFIVKKVVGIYPCVPDPYELGHVGSDDVCLSLERRKGLHLFNAFVVSTRLILFFKPLCVTLCETGSHSDP